MASDFNGLAIQIQFDGATWTDVTTDVRGTEPIVVDYGIDGNSPDARVAKPGVMTFLLDNSIANSGGLLGYYSPDHANVRSGFALNIRCRIILGCGPYYGEPLYGEEFYNADWIKFDGRLRKIDPLPGSFGPKYTRCEVRDFIDDMALHKIDLLSVQQSRRSDLLFQDAVGNMTVSPVSTNYRTGQETFLYGADDLQDERSTALSVAQKVAISEFGYVYIKGSASTGGILTFEDRHARINSAAYTSLGASDIRVLDAGHNIDNIFNRVRGVSYPRAVGSTNETLFTLQRQIELSGSTTVCLTGRYSDPNSLNARISGASMITPCPTTDYKFGSACEATSNDLVGNLTVSASYGANSVDYSLRNEGGTAGYVNLLQARGKAIRIYEPAIANSEDATSQAAYGKRELSLTLAYQDNPLAAQDFSDTTLAAYKDPQTFINQAGVTAVGDQTTRAALKTEPGDRITLAEPINNISGDYFVQGVRLEIRPPYQMSAFWVVKFASAEQAWLLGNSGFTELGTTTILGT